jgi:hypothetical protein
LKSEPFSRKAPWQSAETPFQAVFGKATSALEGHEFTRAVKFSRITRASALEAFPSLTKRVFHKTCLAFTSGKKVRAEEDKS